jgi:hypothetical protein
MASAGSANDVPTTHELEDPALNVPDPGDGELLFNRLFGSDDSTRNCVREHKLMATAGLLFYHIMHRFGQTRTFEEFKTVLETIAKSVTDEFSDLLVSIIQNYQESHNKPGVLKRTASGIVKLAGQVGLGNPVALPVIDIDHVLNTFSLQDIEEIERLPDLIRAYKEKTLISVEDMLSANNIIIQFTVPNSAGWTHPELLNTNISGLFGKVFINLISVPDYPGTVLRFLTRMVACLGYWHRNKERWSNFWTEGDFNENTYDSNLRKGELLQVRHGSNQFILQRLMAIMTIFREAELSRHWKLVSDPKVHFKIGLGAEISSLLNMTLDNEFDDGNGEYPMYLVIAALKRYMATMEENPIPFDMVKLRGLVTKLNEISNDGFTPKIRVLHCVICQSKKQQTILCANKIQNFGFRLAQSCTIPCSEFASVCDECTEAWVSPTPKCMVCMGGAKQLTPLIMSNLAEVKTDRSPLITCEIEPSELMSHMRIVCQNDPTKSRGFEDLLVDVGDIMKLYCEPAVEPHPRRPISDPIIDAEVKEPLALGCVPQFALTGSINDFKAITKPRDDEIPEIIELHKNFKKVGRKFTNKIDRLKGGRMPAIDSEILDGVTVPERPVKLGEHHADESSGLHNQLVAEFDKNELSPEDIGRVWAILEKRKQLKRGLGGSFFSFGGQPRRDTKKRYRAQNKYRTSKSKSKSKPKTKKYNTKKRLTRRRYTTKK